MNTNEIGSFIAALRKANGMTQRELAERIGVSDKSVSRWERGDGLPDLTLIPVIAEVFEVTCDELLTGKRQGERAPKLQQTEQQAGRISAVAVEQFRAQTLIATLIGALAVIFSTVLGNVWHNPFNGGLVGVSILLVAAVVEWIFLSTFRGRLDSPILSEEHRRDSWERVFPYLTLFAGVMTLGTVYIFYRHLWRWGDVLVYGLNPTYDDAIRFGESFPVMSALFSVVVSAVLFFGWIRPYLAKKCPLGEDISKKTKHRIPRVLAVLMLVTLVLRFGVISAPYGCFVQGAQFGNLEELQQYLDEKKPTFLSEEMEQSHKAANNFTIIGGDGTKYNYQNYSIRDEVLFTPVTVFPATVYTKPQQDLGKEIQNYLYTGLFFAFPLELLLCGGMYFRVKSKSIGA